MAAESLGIVPGEAVLQKLAHEGLGIGQGDDAVADIADGRDAERLAQPARRSAVVGHGHDRRDVARVFLEAAQQRRKTGPAAERHDPWAAGAEPLAIDDVDEGLVRLSRDERRHQDADHPPGAEGEERDAGGADDEGANAVGEELQSDDRDDRLRRPGDLGVAVDLPQPQRACQSQTQLPGEDQKKPALHPDPGPQPAPQPPGHAQPREPHSRSSSRWKTATVPKPRFSSQPRSCSAMTMER